ncbi:hypothetical protein M7I_3149 [Glarea lozoyensis 74030]|uniref:Uncharacterized protein n=1 Tax=Glarea lozoyensis (strain ATCC 74030 / MF5533) TaxID=1104152 RepID=H0EKS0_GLAL7|nr:hypothetical protein M7I_3149 [Glarea lozoyensis 74030]
MPTSVYKANHVVCCQRLVKPSRAKRQDLEGGQEENEGTAWSICD